MKKVELKSYDMRPEAEMDLEILRASGISAELTADDVGYTHSIANLGSGIRIMVPQDDLEKSKNLIQGQELHEGEESW